MTDSSQNAYLRTMISTASPAELRLMLFDGAVRFAEQARAGLEQKNFEQLHNGITRCQDIVMELINSLRPEHNPDMCEKLTALYVFIYTRLLNAGSQREIEPLNEALELLQYERDTWALALKKLASENQRAGEVSESPLPVATQKHEGTATPNAASNLIGGRVSVKG
jgi:flagellar secretion chaperone FliS